MPSIASPSNRGRANSGGLLLSCHEIAERGDHQIVLFHRADAQPQGFRQAITAHGAQDQAASAQEIIGRLRLLRSLGETDQHKIADRSEEHTSELQSLMRISYAVFCLKKKRIYTQATPKQDDSKLYNKALTAMS